MHLDISRDSFDPALHYLRVLQNQGGALLDADGNEQTAILLDYLHKLVIDLSGPAWGPAEYGGFQIGRGQGGDLTIGTGRYYVGGYLVENENDAATYSNQPSFPQAAPADLKYPLGVYLDVWERHLNAVEIQFSDPGLGQLSSSTRTQLVWQVRVTQLPGSSTLPKGPPLPAPDVQLDTLQKQLKEFLKPHRQTTVQTVNPDGTITVAVSWPPFPSVPFFVEIGTGQFQVTKVSPGPTSALLNWTVALGSFQPAQGTRVRLRNPTPTLAPSPLQIAAQQSAPPDPVQCPSSNIKAYTGMENQLYRVEVHSGGPVFAAGATQTQYATFKWSRDNGSIVYAIKDITPPANGTVQVTLMSAGIDDYNQLQANNWVEYVDEASTLNFDALADVAQPKMANPLLQVIHVDPLNPTSVTLTALLTTDGNSWPPAKLGDKAFLRRWDQTMPAADPNSLTPSDNALKITVSSGASASPIQLDSDGIAVSFAGNNFRRGDYWLIPARIATQVVLWPPGHQAVRPKSTNHYYAPLVVFLNDTIGPRDCRYIAHQGVPVSLVTAGSAPTLLAEGVNWVTGADSTTGVVLPAATPGMQIVVKNNADAALSVSPATGDAITGALGAHATNSQPPRTSITYYFASPNTWVFRPTTSD
jgi:hypothetical protein